ncbi:MAG: hypothetical protein EON54_21265 [Alcaligenaceae bacterium]|nr:MAG: hypothetical protein EON54_21265 [Alcaligenaceae bacterium]
MNDEQILEKFRHRVLEEWLPEYCADPARQYSPEGFRLHSLRLSAMDARDCMRAIDGGVVELTAPGRFKARRGTATEPLFWEGARKTTPRPITFWLEPAITFAALARLHFDYGWPVDLLANQPRTWAFDLAAHNRASPNSYRILGEIKKSESEAERLVQDLKRAGSASTTETILPNSARKWDALVRLRPSLLWIVGPSGFSKVYRCDFSELSTVRLEESGMDALRYEPASERCETVLEVVGEGGGYTVFRFGNEGTWRFGVSRQDVFSESSQHPPKSHETLREALDHINPGWPRLRARLVHPDYADELYDLASQRVGERAAALEQWVFARDSGGLNEHEGA